MTDERLLEPALYYKELKVSFEEKAEALFELLVEKSGVDANENRKIEENLSQALKLLSKYKSRRTAFIVLLVLSIGLIGAAAYLVYAVAQSGLGLAKDGVRALMAVAFAAAGMIFLIFSIMRISKHSKMIKNQESAVKSIEDRAWQQMNPLLSIMNTEDFCRIIDRCVPSFKIASRIPSAFSKRLMERSERESGIMDHLDFISSDDVGVRSALSGSVDGKLFLLISYIQFSMGVKTYVGTRAFSYTDFETDSDGKMRRVTRYETLTATLDKPYPFYYPKHRAVYFSSACPNLSFYRTPVNVKGKSDRQLERLSKKAKRKFSKMEKESLKSGKPFTALSDSAFEGMFNTQDRDNDVEFRMMYTPYAIKHFTELVKSSDGFADDFCLEKDGCSTSCILEGNKAGSDNRIRPAMSDIASHSFDVAKNRYMTNAKGFFRDFFFILAPLFSVPIYAQSESEGLDSLVASDDISDYSEYDVESVASANTEAFRPNESVTDVILKARSPIRLGYGEMFTIGALSFRAEQRTELVYVVGFHVSGNVPVIWKEFIPVRKDTIMFVRYIGLPQIMAEKAIEKAFFGRLVMYKDGMLGVVADESDIRSDEFKKSVEEIAAYAAKYASERGEREI